MVGITARCSLLLVLVLCGRVSCTSYVVSWTETFLTTLSNSLNVYVNDKVFFNCSATDTSDVLYVNSKERFDNCDTTVLSPSSILLVACMDNDDLTEIVVLNNSLPIPHVPVSVPGSSMYIIGSNANDCNNGLKLALNINIKKNPNPGNSITITPTAPPPTSTTTVVSPSSTASEGTVSSPVSPVSSVSSGGGANVGGATTASSVYTIGHTPSADGTNEKGNESVQFFIGWSLGARVGLIVGCLVGVGVVATCLLCLVCLVCCCYKCLCKQEKSDRIESLDMDKFPNNDVYKKLESENSLTSDVYIISATTDDNKKNYKETVDDNKRHYKEDTDAPAKTNNSISDNKSNGLSGTKSTKLPARPPPKNSIRPLRDPPRSPPTALTSLPARGSNNPPKNLPPLASLPVQSPRRKAPPPPIK